VGDGWGLTLDFLLPPRPAVRWLRETLNKFSDIHRC
jgi:hypothetical protein